MERQRRQRLTVLFSNNLTSKTDPIGQPAPGKGKFGCWVWELGGLCCRHLFSEREEAVSLLTALLGQEPQQAADGREDQMVVQLEPPHMGAQSHQPSVTNATVRGDSLGRGGK